MSKSQSARVYIGNLGTSGVKSEIEREFSKYGPLKTTWVARSPPGFAFVEFEDTRDAEDAVKELNDRRVCGVRVRVELSTHQGRTARQAPPEYTDRSKSSYDDKYSSRTSSRGRFDDNSDDRYSKRSPRRWQERSPETDRYSRRHSRSRSRSPISRN